MAVGVVPLVPVGVQLGLTDEGENTTVGPVMVMTPVFSTAPLSTKNGTQKLTEGGPGCK